MRTASQLLLTLVLLLGADDPTAAPPPGPTPAPGPTSTAPTPAAPPPLAPPPLVPAAPMPVIPEGATGDELLKITITELSSGHYENAIALAIPGIVQHPELEPSFRAVADLAADQLERRRQVGVAPAVVAPGLVAPGVVTAPATTAYTPPSGYGQPPPSYRRQPPARRRNRSELLWGFDVGLPTGLRVEWRFGGKAVDSIGLRIGGNLIAYDGIHDVADVTMFGDFRVAEKWQIEVVSGLLTYYGWAYGQIGAAVQYDPKGPMFVNAGARIGPYAAVLPDVGVGFVW